MRELCTDLPYKVEKRLNDNFYFKFRLLKLLRDYLRLCKNDLSKFQEIISSQEVLLTTPILCLIMTDISHISIGDT